MAVSLDTLIRASTPPPAPLAMPRQDLGTAPRATFRPQGWRTACARLITFGGALFLTAWAAREMYLIMSPNQITGLQGLMLVLFVITFGWIAVGATGAVAGVFFGGGRYQAASDARPKGLTVLLMPVYNEDPARTFAALYAMGRALADQGLGRHVELFVISDSTNPDAWMRETTAWHALREALSGRINVWYRRRALNTAKKAGNVHDFVTQWGARYDYMVVLDADSMMAPATIGTLIREMDADPRCGILQTLPRLCGGTTLLARMQQFAGAVYGPVVARGITAWQGDDGNYWGHNAIIRVRAFAAAAGLPTLPGKRPFGGEIMSHDFVEASLVRRAGWAVRMLPELDGSWEECPPTLLDMAVRDRRWAQGNMQHLAVLWRTRGLRWPNRVHMLIGVMSYLSSPLWLALIMSGLVVTIQSASRKYEYFSERFQLFPNWPQFDAERMMVLFFVTMGVLLLPKVLGLVRGFFAKDVRRAGWPLTLTLGVMCETLLSVFYAPICMLIHSRQVWEIFSGHDSGWEAQQRGHRAVQWRPLFQRHLTHTLLGVALTAVLWWAAPPLLIWMAPTLLGLTLAIPLSAWSGCMGPATLLRRLHLMRIREELEEPEIYHRRDVFEEGLGERLARLDMASFLSDPAALERHCRTLLPAPPPVRGQPDVERVAVSLKLKEATSVPELVGWLSRRELLALLNDPQLLAALSTVGLNQPPPGVMPLRQIA